MVFPPFDPAPTPRRRFKAIPVRTLLLTASIDKAQVVQALKLGAYGVILKESTSQRLFESIRCVMGGQYWVGRESVSDLVRALRSVSPSTAGGPRPKDFGLTRRELEILTLVAQGMSNREIAGKLYVSENTVKTHCSRAFDKLGAARRTQAVQRGKELGLLP